MALNIGVLALQGAVEEHVACLQKLGCTTVEIKTTKDLEGLDGIICPGGESTTMAIVGEKGGLFPALKTWVNTGRPIWGTCAGMILLSDYAIKQASAGQSLVGGLDVHVCRNYFGSQVFSCEYDIQSTKHSSIVDSSGIFIRAPAILKCGPSVNVLGTVSAAPHPSALAAVQSLLQGAHSPESMESATDQGADISRVSEGKENLGTGFVATLQSYTSLKGAGARSGASSASSDGPHDSNAYQVAVAVRQGNILATAFHPELSDDLRWHRFFLDIAQDHKKLLGF